MFVKVNLILICALLFNIGEVNSDCIDFVQCVGDWIGDLLANDKRDIPVKAVEVPDVISAVGDILTNISRLIEDTFNATKETSFSTNLGNKTEIHVETFQLNDNILKGSQTSEVNNTKLSNVIEEHTNTQNIFELKESNTRRYDVEKGTEDTLLSSEIPVTFSDLDYVSATENSNYNIITKTNIESRTTDDSITLALSEESLSNIGILPKTSFENTGYDNLNFSYNFSEALNHNNLTVTYNAPFNTTDVVVNKTLQFENRNASTLFINIPETVATNYKITFESPINVTYFEINTNVQVNAKTNSTEIKTNTTNFNTKNSIENQNIQENEILGTEYEIDDVVIDDNSTDYLAIDYIDLYKDTTNEDVDYTPATYIPTTTEAIKSSIEINETNGIYSVFPWIATLFIKNNDNSQFEYICDGVLLSDRVVLTAARCVIRENITEDVGNILVILGKRSLQDAGANEKVLRVKAVKLHENFTAAEGKVDNDLAIIVLAEPIAFNDDIQPVPLESDDNFEAIQTATTGWHVTGRLTPIYFDKESSKTCKKNTVALSTFCAVFGDDITTCPSYGGLFIARRNEIEWSLQGVTAGSPTNRGACFNKNVTFTRISHYHQWIVDNIELNKV